MLAAGVFKPSGYVGGEAATDDDVDGGRGVNGQQQHLGAGQQGLGAGAGWEGRWIKIERTAVSEHVACGRAAQTDDGLAGAYVNHGGKVAG